MIRSFRDPATERLWSRQRVKSIDPRIERVALRKLVMLDAAETLDDLRVPPGNRLEALRGDRLRCEGCYEMRFRVAAAMAKQLSCDAFTSTLLVSPYQKHDLIREVGERVARETGGCRVFRPGATMPRLYRPR